jgi:hypothetical protein
MSWFTAARNVMSRWGTPARFAVRHVIAAAFPGGSVVGELLDDLLECAQDTAKDQEEAEARARTMASDEELRQVEEVLLEVNGRLSDLMDQVARMDGIPDAADRLIRLALANDEAVRAGFANLASLIGELDRILILSEATHANVLHVKAEQARLGEGMREICSAVAELGEKKTEVKPTATIVDKSSKWGFNTNEYRCQIRIQDSYAVKITRASGWFGGTTWSVFVDGTEIGSPWNPKNISDYSHSWEFTREGVTILVKVFPDWFQGSGFNDSVALSGPFGYEELDMRGGRGQN